MAVFLYSQLHGLTILFSLLASLSNSVAIHCYHSPSHFKVQPSDQRIKEGDSATFTCTSRNFNVQTDTLSWNIVPNIYAVEEDEMFNSSSHEMTSIITVKNIEQTNQYFRCNLHTHGNPGDQQKLCFASRKVTLYVQYFPNHDELRCIPAHPMAIKEGQPLRIMCEVPRGEPAVDLSWRFHPPGVNDQHLPTLHDDGAYRVLSYNLFVKQQLHLKEIVCRVTSDLVFPGLRHQCSIGPITVLYPPHVFVQPRQVQMIGTSPTELVCMADGYPEHFNYSWSCFPDGILGGCNGKGQKANLYLRRSSDISGIDYLKQISVTCTVTNSEGTGTGSSRITISKQLIDEMQVGNVELDSLGCEDGVDLNITVHAKKGLGNNSELTVVCTASSSTEGCNIQKVIWYLGNSSYCDSAYNVMEGKVSSELSVGMDNISGANEIQAVACEVRVANITVRSMFNLSKFVEKHMANNVLNHYTSNSTDQYSSPPSRPRLSDLQVVTVKSLNDNSNGGDLHSNMSNGDKESSITDTPKGQVLKMWQIVTFAVGGVLVTVILTACVVTIISIYMYKHFTSIPCANPKSSQNLDGYQERYSIASNIDPIYDVPHDPTLHKFGRCKSLPDIAKDERFSLKHIYDSSVYHSSYISTSSGSSWGSCTDSNEDHRYTHDSPSSASSDRSLSGMAKYGNGRVVQMELDRRHTLSHDASLKQYRQELAKSMHPLPLIKYT